MPARRKKKRRTSPIQSLRRSWTRNPAQKAHSTEKGEKGYQRTRARKQVAEQVEQERQQETK